MKLKCALLSVKDMERSKAFYKEVLGLRTTLDFGANVTLSGGLNLQTEESWLDFLSLKEDDIRYGGNDAEIYFEEDDFDKFIEHLNSLKNIRLVHPPIEHSWGQRAVRFYDPDMHIIEVGENLKAVAMRFFDCGMSESEVAERMDVPLKVVKSLKGKH